MPKTDRFRGVTAAAMHAVSRNRPQYAAPRLTLPPRGPVRPVSRPASNNQTIQKPVIDGAKTTAKPPALGAFLRKFRYLAASAAFSVFTRLSDPFWGFLSSDISITSP